jgi:transposase
LPHGGGAQAKLSEAQRHELPALVTALPDATLDELRGQLKKRTRVEVSLSTICRGLQALGLSRKKSPSGPSKPTLPSGPRSKRPKRRESWTRCSFSTNSAST